MSGAAETAGRLTQSQTGWSISPPPMRPDPRLAVALASAFLAGQQSVDAIATRGTRVLGRRWRWLLPLARRYFNAFSDGRRPRRRSVVQFLLEDRGFVRAWSKHSSALRVEHWPITAHRMQPVPAATSWKIPKIESVAALAEWLGTDITYVQWFADLKGLGYKENRPKLRHYHYRILTKESGNIRLIEAPKQALKKLQQRILDGILDKIPSHTATHGFVIGRSIKTFVTPHVGQQVVLRMDLRNFFPSFRAARIQSFFRMLGYPESVADLLGGMCTNATPRDVWKQVGRMCDPVQIWESRILYSRPHLPQGAPTSPALANLLTFRLDCRLAGLAASVGAQYTRYADDLAFSGDETFESRVDRFSTHVAAVLADEGFAVHHRKTRIMRQGVRQRLVGLIANQHPNILRADFDRLKAVLTNCVRKGPETQNRDAHHNFRAHLEGRVSFVEMINSSKGKRLRKLLELIRWE